MGEQRAFVASVHLHHAGVGTTGAERDTCYKIIFETSWFRYGQEKHLPYSTSGAFIKQEKEIHGPQTLVVCTAKTGQGE
jgi:hypothetical protein